MGSNDSKGTREAIAFGVARPWVARAGRDGAPGGGVVDRSAHDMDGDLIPSTGVVALNGAEKTGAIKFVGDWFGQSRRDKRLRLTECSLRCFREALASPARR